jgi:hypothetical protein
MPPTWENVLSIEYMRTSTSLGKTYAYTHLNKKKKLDIEGWHTHPFSHIIKNSKLTTKKKSFANFSKTCN